MLADIHKDKNGYIACFERHLDHSIEAVWSWLTENQKLAKWFAELSIEKLQEGGIIKFYMQDGTFEKLTIIDLQIFSVLEYTWGEDSVRFELSQEQGGCKLMLIEKINEITPHTPKDLAGWHVCLDVIKAQLDDCSIDFRKEEWAKWNEKYIQVIADLKNG